MRELSEVIFLFGVQRYKVLALKKVVITMNLVLQRIHHILTMDVGGINISKDE